jgi:catechol 2,3-dioxygenase-like lactoylglutathione lyase family enzyme
MTMTKPKRAALSHVSLTVTNLEKSVPWYASLFDVTSQMEEAFPGGRQVLLADPEWKLLIVLSHHDANRGEQFAESRTGMDHTGFLVDSRDELVAWQAQLESNGVVKAAAADRPLTQSPIEDHPYASLLTFRDPDNIQLHFMALPSQ